jgi:hypothetical protein
VGRRRVNGDDEGGVIWLTYFVFMYENSPMKHFEIVLRRGR